MVQHGTFLDDILAPQVAVLNFDIGANHAISPNHRVAHARPVADLRAGANHRVAIDLRRETDLNAPLLVHIVAQQLVGGAAAARQVIVGHERARPAPNNVLAEAQSQMGQQ